MILSPSPRTPVISNFSHDTGAVGDHITSESNPTLIITADAGTTVEVFNGLTSLGTAVETFTPGVFTFSAPVLADGTYDFTATATNSFENTSAASDSFQLTIDGTAPAAPSITDIVQDTGAPHDHVTSDAAPTLFIEAEHGSTVTVYQDGVAVGTATELAQAGAFIFSAPADLADGTYHFTAQTADAAGNVSTASDAMTVVIDHVAPTTPTVDSIADDTGTAGDNITSDNTPTLTIHAEHGSVVEVYNGDSFLGQAIESETESGTFELTLGGFKIAAPDPLIAPPGPLIVGLEDGTYHLSVISPDTAGNHSAAAALDLTIDQTAPDAPSIFSFETDTGAIDDQITSNTTPTFTINAEHGASIEVFQDGVSVGHAVEGDEPGTFTFSSAALDDGVYDFTAVATDVAGNVSTTSDAFEVTIDHTAPDAPVIDSVAGGLIEITAEAGSTVDIYRDGELAGTALEIADGVFQLDDDGYGPGISYTAVATDVAENVSTMSDAVVSNHAPVITLPSDGETYELHINENTTDAGMVTATDAEGDALTYSITDGADADAFSIDPETGALTLLTPADYELPNDYYNQGAYDLVVSVTDGEFTTSHSVVVVVDDVVNEKLVGTENDDRLVGANGDSTIAGLGGDDLLIGGSGNDRIDGGSGIDVMAGGAGNDVYYVDNWFDQIDETTTSYGATVDAGGNDTVYSTVSYFLSSPGRIAIPVGNTLSKGIFNFNDGARFVENLALRGTDNLNAAGNALDNRLAGNDGMNHIWGLGGNDLITGGAGGDKLEGGDGNDKLYGGDGRDRLIGGAGKDSFVFNTALNASTNKDVISDFSHSQGDRIQLSIAIFDALHSGPLAADEFYAAADARGAHDANDHIIYNTTTGALLYDADGIGGKAAIQFATVNFGESHPTLLASDFLISA